MRYLPLLLLCTVPAWAAPYATVNVSDSTPTNVTASLSGMQFKTILVENGGSNAIYCSADSAVTTDTGHEVLSGDKATFPYDGPVYCIAATDAQTGTGRDHTIIWGSPQ